MKKLFPLFLFVLFNSAGYSQTMFSIFAGPQVTGAKYSIKGVEQTTDYQTNGLMAGISLRMPIEEVVYFTPAVYYSKKGYKVNFNNISNPPDSAALNNNTSINSIEVAPLIQVAFSNRPTHAFIRFGPTIDFNISGTERFEKTTGEIGNRNMTFSYDAYSFATTAATIQLGFQTKSGFQIFGHYGHGLGSLNNIDEGPKIRHRIAGITLGWLFGNNNTALW
ncbi:MAG TPA: outer membrane beta-barrel protein [Flavisolibacter sp.]|nr:outer membrane beta-barrel protein [Flavisolibacter sp.]